MKKALLVAGIIVLFSALGFATPVSITTPVCGSQPCALQNGSNGSAYSFSFGATGGFPPYSWSITSGSVSGCGLTLSVASGVLSGTATTDVCSATVLVTDTFQQTANVQVTVAVSSLPPIPSSCAGQAITPTLSLLLPQHGLLNWDACENYNMSVIDELWGSGDGGGGGSMVYPPAGVPNSTGSSWGTPYQVGSSNSDIPQLTNGQLPISEIPNLPESQINGLTSDLANRALVSTTVNGHPLSQNVVVSASDLTTGTLPHAQLPALVSGDIPNNAANTTGAAAGLSSGATILGLPDGCLNVASNIIGSSGSPCGSGGGGGIGYPSVGIPSSTGGAWGSSYTTTGNGSTLALSGSPVFTGTPTVPGYVPTSLTVNGHALTGNVILSASDLTTGTLPVGQLPPIPYADLTGAPAIPTSYSSNPNMDGAAAPGSSSQFSRGDHTHPSDTTRVATSTTVNGHALSSNVVVSASDLNTGTLPASAEPAHAGDVTNTAASLVMKVGGINAVPLCNGFTPTANQALIYTTSSTPNPCWTAATPTSPSTWSALLTPTGNLTMNLGTDVTTFNEGDFGSSPVNSAFGIADTATSTADTSTDFSVTVPANSYHNALNVSIDAFAQLQVCNVGGSSHIGITVIGNKITCPNLPTTSPGISKTWIMDGTGTHTSLTLYQDGSSATATMLQGNSAAAGSSSNYFWSFCNSVPNVASGFGNGTCAGLAGGTPGTVAASLDTAGGLHATSEQLTCTSCPNETDYTLNNNTLASPASGKSGYGFDTTGNGGVFKYYENGGGWVGLTAVLASKVGLIGGLVPTADLGTGSASSTTCLIGSQAWSTCALSVFGRTGVITAATGDYTQAQITPTAIVSTTGSPSAVTIAGWFNSGTTVGVPSGTFTITLSSTQPPTTNGAHADIINYGTGVITLATSGQNLNGGTSSITVPAGSATAPTGAHIVWDGTNYEAAVWGAPVSTGPSDTTVSVSSGSQGANSCSSSTPVTMTGLTTSMVPLVGYSASPTSYTGWGSTGGMVFQAWPSAANTLSWQVCNQTASSISYSAITFNVGAK